MKLAAVAALTALYLAGKAVAGSAYSGCIFGPASLPLFSFPFLLINSLSACQQTCVDNNYSYAFFGSGLGCYCNVVGPITYSVTTGSSAASCSGLSAYRLSTTFSDAQCFSSVTFSPKDTYQPQTFVDPGECFNACKSYRYAVYWPVNLLKVWNCKCANNPYTTSGSGCNQDSYFVFNHSPAAAASGLARREVREIAEREQKALQENLYCPSSYTPCYVSEDKDDGYECIRPSMELESCGGCRFGQYNAANSTLGVDCTAIPGVLQSGVTCTDGACQVSQCRRGYRLIDGECISR